MFTDFFKAVVFMCVGNILRTTRGYQDIIRTGFFIKIPSV